MTNFNDVLKALEAEAQNTREKGTLFENLMEVLLPQLPDHAFDKVWTWQAWPDRKQLTGQDGKDIGIDLVGQMKDGGEYCAIQCKFNAATHSIQKGDIDSFFTEMGKEPFTSGLIITTTDKWTKNAEAALKNQTKNMNTLRLADFAGLEIDWDIHKPTKTRVRPTIKELFSYQQVALTNTIDGFKTHDRGKMIMACGTGKTLTALHIAEKMAPKSGHVLFLVPSIALMAQTLQEWAYQRARPHRYLAVCSDAQVDKNDENGRIEDLAIPATTDARQVAAILNQPADRLTIVFSTYQSLERIHEAQRLGAPDFDLVICDEAHRTTGIDDSKFSKINEPDYIMAKKRLYMTATPRLYTADAKQQAKTRNIGIYSMDDEATYGPEFYRLDFSKAVGENLLSDYRVIILNVSEEYISREMQSVLAENNKLEVDDIAKIVGCYKALRDQGEKDGVMLKRAVSFSTKIDESKAIAKGFQKIVEGLNEKENDGFTCQTDHVDGKQSAFERSRKLDWLKEDSGSNEHGEICRILSNARCLTEGVDVPTLDAVMFMSSRKSKVDIVQAVGRVMRKAAGKKYGYIILPIVIPSDVTPEDALNDNKVYGVVWDVLNALRSHDDRFNATINQIELNKQKSKQIKVIGVGFGEGEREEFEDQEQKMFQDKLDFGDLELAIYAKIVEKVGDRKYWETWAKSVADIHTSITKRIDNLRKTNVYVEETWQEFYTGIRTNINDALSEDDATSMLAQHLITEPVFDALFAHYEFSKSNPVSQTMQKVLARLYSLGLEKELADLERFYKSVSDRASGINNAEGRQKVIIELYEKFFKTAFPKVADTLGIAYTPIEIVDFVLKSADHALREEFGRGLTDENVHIIDPFTGTGSFVNRLIQSDLIKDKDLKRKFTSEIHANEILLLAYYIASVNIEEAYHERMKQNDAGDDYESFPGIVLTDTFNLYERDGDGSDDMFPENNARVKRQRAAPIRVVVGNPPWSAGQKSENHDAQNMTYPKLDTSIRGSYAKESTATNKNALYDSYIRSMRWASNRIGDEGVIAYVSNGGWLDSTSTDGLRQCLAEEFDAIWVFNARGNARLSGEPRRKEKDNVFGQACRTPVTFTILVKNPQRKRAIADIHYHDIGDYLSRKEKLNIITGAEHIGGLNWQAITPNDDNDWINQRDPFFQTFKAMGSKEVKAGNQAQPDTIFRNYSSGVKTNRDAWAYNFNKEKLSQNMQGMIGFYNEQVEGFQKAKTKTPNLTVDEFIDNDSIKIKWSGSLKTHLKKYKQTKFSKESLRTSLYRPFEKENLYFSSTFIEGIYRMPSFFPTPETENRVIGVSGPGAATFSPMISNMIPNLHFLDTGQCFPRYVYNDEGEREDNIPDICVREFQTHYKDKKITGDDIFDYVYGVLHAPDYQTRFASDLKKQLPRIPFAQDFHAFRDAGRKLAKLHLNFETSEEYPLNVLVNGQPVFDGMVLRPEDYKMHKLKWDKANNTTDKSRLVYNAEITLSAIPDEAHQYMVSGRSALQWILDRYQVKTDKDSGIVNDPNDWITEQNDPQWLIRHIKRVCHLSVESTKIITALPCAV